MQFRLGKKDGNLVIGLKGDLAEDSEAILKAQLPRLKAAHVVIDCSGIGGINSVGFRGWQSFLKSLDKDSTFEFTNCPPDFIDFCNLLPNTSYSQKVTSLFVPYICETCRRESLLTFAIGDLAPEQAFDLVMCPKCNGTMGAAVPPDEYLRFLRPQL